ncbi:SLAM family member 5-like isoform X2 [Mugil cephalus]|uniref:SLAM family member 5-like isoform X2 n=1 Tax=Mugil cephalus TaxID=48193 RepID=UPI001FB61EFB|nr:SLAM family member 5-like isoform X2 [Mugil cephalus]
MELKSFLLVVSVLYSSQIQGSSAVTDVFVKRGDDVLLEVMDDAPKEFLVLVWKFNTSNVLVGYSPGGKPRVSEGYTGRVEFSVGNYSVKLKNLQDDDSGVYTARVTGDKEQTVAKYMVTVQGPVSPVDLNPDSVSSSSDSCNLTVTCSTEGSHISSTFTCDTKTCSQEGGDQSKVTNSGASLRVHLLNDMIICHHSNQVSWTQKKMAKIQDLCLQHAGLEHPRNHIITIMIAVIVGILVIAVVLIMLLGCYRHRKRRKYDRENKENTEFTEYAAVETPYNQNQRSADGDSANNPTSIYSLAGPPTGRKGSTKTKTNNQPESLYATVDKAPRP